MPAIPTLHLALTKPLVDSVRQQVASGDFLTTSAVVRAALGTHADSKMIEMPPRDRTTEDAARG